MIIINKRSILRKTLEVIITVCGWIFLITFLYQFIINFDMKVSFKFYSLTLANSNAIVLFTAIVTILSSGLLMSWSSYNKRKYGSLKRRNFPSPTTNEEMMEYYKVSEDQLKKIQKDRYTELV